MEIFHIIHCAVRPMDRGKTDWNYWNPLTDTVNIRVATQEVNIRLSTSLPETQEVDLLAALMWGFGPAEWTGELFPG